MGECNVWAIRHTGFLGCPNVFPGDIVPAMDIYYPWVLSQTAMNTFFEDQPRAVRIGIFQFPEDYCAAMDIACPSALVANPP
ncbi:MAG: hypothetical protein STSR0009_25280 [Methanoregula sp.]